MWHCAFKFPYDYYVLKDKNGKQIASSKDEKELKAKKKKEQKIFLKTYEGCPAHNTKSKTKDDFEF